MIDTQPIAEISMLLPNSNLEVSEPPVVEGGSLIYRRLKYRKEGQPIYDEFGLDFFARIPPQHLNRPYNRLRDFLPVTTRLMIQERRPWQSKDDNPLLTGKLSVAEQMRLERQKPLWAKKHFVVLPKVGGDGVEYYLRVFLPANFSRSRYGEYEMRPVPDEAKPNKPTEPQVGPILEEHEEVRSHKVTRVIANLDDRIPLASLDTRGQLNEQFHGQILIPTHLTTRKGVEVQMSQISRQYSARRNTRHFSAPSLTYTGGDHLLDITPVKADEEHIRYVNIFRNGIRLSRELNQYIEGDICLCCGSTGVERRLNPPHPELVARKLLDFEGVVKDSMVSIIKFELGIVEADSEQDLKVQPANK